MLETRASDLLSTHIENCKGLERKVSRNERVSHQNDGRMELTLWFCAILLCSRRLWNPFTLEPFRHYDSAIPGGRLCRDGILNLRRLGGNLAF